MPRQGRTGISGGGSSDDSTVGGGSSVLECLRSGGSSGDLLRLFAAPAAKVHGPGRCAVFIRFGVDFPDSRVWDLRRRFAVGVFLWSGGGRISVGEDGWSVILANF